MTDEQDPPRWPVEPEVVVARGPGTWQLVLLYALPFLVLFALPAVAWVGLFPGAIGLRWTTHPPHRRRLVALYLVVGAISVAPWIAWLVRGDIAELTG